MANLKAIESTDDLFLYMAFHPSKEETFLTDTLNLEKMMDDQFGDDQECLLTNRTESVVIYRVQKPIFATKEEQETFFKKLRLIFNSASTLLPHFTQFQESDYL